LAQTNIEGAAMRGEVITEADTCREFVREL
jgi:hypothetical protein